MDGGNRGVATEKAARHLREPNPRADDLTRAGTARELLVDFDDLCDAGCTDRMTAAC
jgi:hypothetical protein